MTMTGSTRDERFGPSVNVPELTGKLDAVTTMRMRNLAEDTSADPAEVRREQRRIIAERRASRAAERARQAAAVAQLDRDVRAAVNLATRGT